MPTALATMFSLLIKISNLLVTQLWNTNNNMLLRVQSQAVKCFLPSSFDLYEKVALMEHR